MDYKINEIEKIGREKLKTTFPTIEWEFTEGLYDNFDAYYKRADSTVIAEIKTRNFDSTKYETTILEKHKVDALMSGKEPITAIYVVNFTDNITCTYNLNNIDWENQKTQTFKMNDSTVRYGQSKKEKEVYKLPLSMADVRFTNTGKKTELPINERRERIKQLWMEGKL